MPEFSHRGSNLYTGAGTVVPTASTAAFSGASGKGNWSQITSSTSYPSYGLWVNAYNNSLCNLLFDIGIGASTQEKVLLPDLFIGGRNGSIHINNFYPIYIPEGSRITVRSWADNGASGAVACSVIFCGTPFPDVPIFGRCTAYGLDGTVATGKTVTAAGSANTKGSYTELIDSTTYPIKAWTMHFGLEHQVTGASAWHYNADIAVGASGSEKILLGDLYLATNTVEVIAPTVLGPFINPIPNGSRLAVRTQCSTASQEFDCVLYGFD